MLTREHLWKFVHQRCRHLNQHLADFCTDHEPEALHHLRVEIKKLKALVRLLQSGNHEQQVRLNPLKELYAQAGIIRTAYLNLGQLRHLQLEHEAFSVEQKRIIAEYSALFCRNQSRYRKKIEHAKAHLQKHTRDIQASKIKTLFKEGAGKLSLFFSGSTLEAGGLHDARKEVKHLLYIHELLPTALSVAAPINTDYLSELQSRIGSWHDNAVTLALLRGFSQPDPALPVELERVDKALLQGIKEFVDDFDQKIFTRCNHPVHVPAASA